MLDHHTADTAFNGWKKSSHSSGNDNCIEVAHAADGTIGLRDTEHPDNGILAISPGSWAAFIAGVRDGEFDQ